MNNTRLRMHDIIIKEQCTVFRKSLDKVCRVYQGVPGWGEREGGRVLGGDVPDIRQRLLCTPRLLTLSLVHTQLVYQRFLSGCTVARPATKRPNSIGYNNTKAAIKIHFIFLFLSYLYMSIYQINLLRQ